MQVREAWGDTAAARATEATQQYLSFSSTSLDRSSWYLASCSLILLHVHMQYSAQTPCNGQLHVIITGSVSTSPYWMEVSKRSFSSVLLFICPSVATRSSSCDARMHKSSVRADYMNACHGNILPPSACSSSRAPCTATAAAAHGPSTSSLLRHLCHP